ncbi:MAG: 3-deoxy-7-phosphoheptulonate synthase [Anaerovoracaceae bacterium]
MIIVLKNNADEHQVSNLKAWLETQGLKIHQSTGETTTILGLIGDTSGVDMSLIKSLNSVENVMRIQDPYKNANIKYHPQKTIVDVNGIKIGDGNFQMIAGPCSVESIDQICSIAEEVKAAGATILRGGAFKPRTSPYAFQGMREAGISHLLEAKRRTGLPVVTEVMDISHLPLFENVDLIQVGARNMQNFELLKELGRIDKPVLLKRGLSSTLNELLMSAEYIMAGGNEQVILCERGIRTFENATRNTLDLSSIPLLKEHTHLPVIVDPSHGTGIAALVKPMSLAAAAAGADGLMIEVHNNPEQALCDGPQSVKPEEFKDILESVNRLLPFAYKG